MDFDYVNERAKKYSLSVERDAFLKGGKVGLSIGIEQVFGIFKRI